MKIRNGFVSNSSSSSFIILGYEITKEEIPELLKSDTTVLRWDHECLTEVDETEDLEWFDSDYHFYKAFFWGDIGDGLEDEVKLEDLNISPEEMKKMKMIFGTMMT